MYKSTTFPRRSTLSQGAPCGFPFPLTFVSPCRGKRSIYNINQTSVPPAQAPDSSPRPASLECSSEPSIACTPGPHLPEVLSPNSLLWGSFLKPWHLYAWPQKSCIDQPQGHSRDSAGPWMPRSVPSCQPHIVIQLSACAQPGGSGSLLE